MPFGRWTWVGCGDEPGWLAGTSQRSSGTDKLRRALFHAASGCPIDRVESMTEPGFPVTLVDGLPVVIAPDEIDVGNAAQLRAALVAAAASRQPVIVVDMTSTEFCDSTGLNVLVRARKQADDDGAELRLVIRGAALHRILNVTGMASMFRIYDSLDEALHSARPSA